MVFPPRWLLPYKLLSFLCKKLRYYHSYKIFNLVQYLFVSRFTILVFRLLNFIYNIKAFLEGIKHALELYKNEQEVSSTLKEQINFKIPSYREICLFHRFKPFEVVQWIARNYPEYVTYINKIRGWMEKQNISLEEACLYVIYREKVKNNELQNE